jgi:predicted RNA-binding Zn ribbon-like protein
MRNEPELIDAEDAARPGVAEKQFDLSSGRLCLDFANTLCGPPDARREELATYFDLVEWARQTGSLDEADSVLLQEVARASPLAAEAALTRARALRHQIFQVLSEAASGRGIAEDSLSSLGDHISLLLAQSRLIARDGGFAWEWGGQPAALDRPLWAVARSASDLLTSPDQSIVKECASPTCSWLFLDTSRNHSRRWCDMNICGNREKARRHYQRHKAG